MDLFYLYIKNFDFKSVSEPHSADGSPFESKCSSLHEAGRYILEYAAKNFYDIKNTELEIINKKPEFKYSGIKFNISHSKDIAAVCFDKNPVGFDIEKILPLDYKAIAKRMNFKLKEESLEEFYKFWTMYEAKLKLQNNVNHCISQKLNKEYIFSVVSIEYFNIDRIEEIKFINC